MEGVLIILIIFGFIYRVIVSSQKNKERMALIRQGINPNEYNKAGGSNSWFKDYSLKIGLVALAVGLGSFVANMFTIFSDEARYYSDELYFSFIAFFGGAALIVNYFLEQDVEKKNELMKKRKKEAQEDAQWKEIEGINE